MAQRILIFQLNVKGDGQNQTIELPLGSTVIGRNPDNNLQLAHDFVSGTHASIECTSTNCFITDLHSTNGTVVDGDRLRPNKRLIITRKSQIRIGPFTLSIEVINSKASAPPPPPPKKPINAAPGIIAEIDTSKPRGAKPSKAPPAITDYGGNDSVPPSNNNGAALGQVPIEPPIGLSWRSERLINYLPSIYHQSDFIQRLLGMLEAIMLPIEWTVDNFDVFLDPMTAPEDFLPWLAGWYDIIFDDSWRMEQRRIFLKEAHEIFAMRGTKSGLSRVLAIYTGVEPQIIDLDDSDNPLFFTVRLPVTEDEYRPELVQALVDAYKPAHTNYRLLFKRS
ncbi:MAG: FHA domain-containing protein [Candidatus Promineifilaceae bacterium]